MPENKSASETQNPAIVSVTPRVPRTDAGDQSIPSVRPQIAHEMEREFVRCEFDAFMKAYFPFVPDEADVKECIDKKLRTRQLMGGTYASTLYFNQYRTPPTNANSEMETYKSLQDIAHAVGRYTHPTRTRNQFHYRDTPYSHITSETSGSTHKVDACFTSDPTPTRSDDKAMKLSTTSMAVPLEFKLSSSKKHENNKQIVSANVQIMNDDVRRMFTFGITIECDQVTLWFHCRSHSAISLPFSLVTDPKKLIKVFMAILFATDEELGYDPLVTLDDQYNYVFNMTKDGGPTRLFQVIEPISIYRSNNITGRMTRIFKVTEINSNPPTTFVLKDVWIEASAKTEGQIQEAIFNDIETFWNETDVPENKKGLEHLKTKHAGLVASKAYKDYFLSIETDLEGSLSKHIVAEYSLQRGLFTPPLPRKAARSIFSGHGSRHSAGTPRPMSNAEQPRTSHRDYLQKKQYRVVFKEVCKSVGELVYVGEVFDILRQVLTPLQLMFCAGWVHRDISCGNILAHMVNNQWQVKLSDLEYAKGFPPPPNYKPATDPKTGTPYFMPYEILDRQYLYGAEDTIALELASYVQVLEQETQTNKQPSPNNETQDKTADVVEPNPFLDDEDSVVNYNDEDDDAEEAEPKSNQIVIHNFQHDLESLWWVLLWTVTARIDRDISNDWAKHVFHNSLTLSWARRTCFNKEILTDMKRILAKPLKCFAPRIELLRNFLKREYILREERGDLYSFRSYVQSHEAFETVFNSILSERSSTWRKVKLTVNGSHQDSGDDPNPHTAGPHGSEDELGDESSGVGGNETTLDAGVTKLAQPARVKRGLTEDEGSPPRRRPGPSKRSRRDNTD